MPERDWNGPRIIRKHKRRIALRALRAGLNKTQVEIAEASGMSQGEISRLESRSDVHVSTLERYAKALGGELEIVIVVGERRFVIVLERA